MKKKIIIIAAVIVLLALLVGGFLIVRHNNSYISAKDALAIAVADAGVDAKTITDSDVDFENKANSAYYEVDFEVGFTEYKYIIDAENGTIIDSKVELD